jgi:YaiO family outer membrane protein
MEVTVRKLCVVVLMLAFASSALAQDTISRARELATAGQRVEALRMLEAHLASNPADNDARTLYGIVLSWEGRYEDARAVLERAIEIDPQNEDARQALANVERWSRRPAERSEYFAGLQYDAYDNSSDWVEPFVSAKVPTRAGPFVARASQARRFSLQDEMVDLEFYPRLGSRSYAWLSGGVATDGVLYPDTRFGAEIFHVIARGVEVSAGARYLGFDDSVMVYSASVGLYRGNWYFAGRGFRADDTSAGQLVIRRYVGDGGHYFGFRAGVGRDEIRSGSDLDSLERTEFVAEALVPISRGFVVNVRAGGGEGKATAMVALGYRR